MIGFIKVVGEVIVCLLKWGTVGTTASFIYHRKEWQCLLCFFDGRERRANIRTGLQQNLLGFLKKHMHFLWVRNKPKGSESFRSYLEVTLPKRNESFRSYLEGTLPKRLSNWSEISIEHVGGPSKIRHCEYIKRGQADDRWHFIHIKKGRWDIPRNRVSLTN